MTRHQIENEITAHTTLNKENININENINIIGINMKNEKNNGNKKGFSVLNKTSNLSQNESTNFYIALKEENITKVIIDGGSEEEENSKKEIFKKKDNLKKEKIKDDICKKKILKDSTTENKKIEKLYKVQLLDKKDLTEATEDEKSISAIVLDDININVTNSLPKENNLKNREIEKDVTTIVLDDLNKTEVLSKKENLKNQENEKDITTIILDDLNTTELLPKKDNIKNLKNEGDTTLIDKKNNTELPEKKKLIKIDNKKTADKNSTSLLKKEDTQDSEENKVKYSMRKRETVNYKDVPASFYYAGQSNNKNKKNYLENGISKNKDTPQKSKKINEKPSEAKYSMRKRKNICYNDNQKYFSNSSNDVNDDIKIIEIKKENNNKKEVKSNNNKKDTPLTLRSSKDVGKETLKDQKPRVGKQKPKLKVHYKLRSSDKKTISEKKKIVKQIIILSPPKEKCINKSKEYKTRRLNQLANENTVGKIKEIFSTLPLFKGFNCSYNIINDEEIEELASDEDEDTKLEEEAKESINDNESISDNDFDDDFEEDTNIQYELQRPTISIPNEKIDNMMEDSLYSYISRFTNSKLKDYMNVIKLMKDPLANFSFQKFKKKKYYTTFTETLLSIKKKDYLSCGIYSDEYRSGVKRRKLCSASHDLESIEKLKKTFKFPKVIYYGELLLNEQQDFKLPIDIYLMVKDPQFKKMLDTIPRVGIPNFKEISQNIYLVKKPLINEARDCSCKKGDNCGETCLNRLSLIECDPKRCPCGDRCTNQRFNRYNKNSKKLKVFWTGNKGYGLKTENPIKKDELVIEYTGEVMSNKSCIDRLNTIYKNMNSFYFIDFGDGKVIDACEKGSIARFANHSCEPNCHIERWTVNDEVRVGLFALRDIKAGEELLYDYNFHSFGEQQKCNCGSKNCRGIIGVNRQHPTININSSACKKKGYKNHKNQSKYYSIKKNWEFLLQEMKDIIRGNLDYKKNHLFLLRNLKYANRQLTIQANAIFKQDELRGYMNYTKSFNNQYQILIKELYKLHSQTKDENIVITKRTIMNEQTLIKFLKKSKNDKAKN